MDLQREIAFLETYFRDFFAYLVRFFYQSETDKQSDDALDLDSRLATFGVISLFLGIILQRTFITGTAFKEIDFPHAIVVEACFWFTITLAIHLAARSLYGPTVKFADTLSAVLRVFPPAFLAAAFGGYIGYAIGHAIGHPVPGMCGAVVDMLAQIVLLLVYLPGSLATSFGKTRFRGWGISLVVVAAIAVIDFCIIFQPPPKPAPAKPASAPCTQFFYSNGTAQTVTKGTP